MDNDLAAAFASGDMGSVLTILIDTPGADVHTAYPEACKHDQAPVAHLVRVGSTVVFWSSIFKAHGQEPNGMDVLAHRSVYEAMTTFEDMREQMRRAEQSDSNPLMQAVMALMSGERPGGFKVI